MEPEALFPSSQYILLIIKYNIYKFSYLFMRVTGYSKSNLKLTQGNYVFTQSLNSFLKKSQL